MSTVQMPVNDLLVQAKTHELQRGMFAEMRGDRDAADRHLLAAAHLELVLADDYSDAGQSEMALRSRISAASCLWRVGDIAQAREIFDAIVSEEPLKVDTIQDLVTELEVDYPE